MRYPLTILSVIFACLASAAAGDYEAMLIDARGQFSQGNRLRFSDPQAAGELYALAAHSFEKCDVTNGMLLYNTGNAYFLAGDIGRAILNYRRAERLIPHDRNLLHNLTYARSRRIDQIRAAEPNRPLKTFLFWHYDLATRTRQILFAIFYIPLWCLAILRIFTRRGAPLWGLAICVIASGLLAGSIMVERSGRTDASAGVVISGEVTPRKGDSQAYQPSFDSSLHAGTEFTILQKRSDWLEIQLIDGRECWIPEAAASTITMDR